MLTDDPPPCPHCGERARAELLAAYEFEIPYTWRDVSMLLDTFEEELDALPSLAVRHFGREPGKYFVVRCDYCKQLLLYRDIPMSAGDDFEDAELVWPDQHFLHYLPDDIAAIYREATAVKYQSSSAFAGQIRRALEAVCVARGITNGNLSQRLAILVKQEHLPPVLAEIADLLRTIGNRGSHHDASGVWAWQVEALEFFFKTLVQHLFALPAELASFRDELRAFDRLLARKPPDSIV